MEGGSETIGSHAPIDSTRLLGTLTDREWGQICDWEADRLGGYGHPASCEANFTPMAPPDQARCVSAVRITEPCDLTVASFERCIDQRVANPCAFTFRACDPITVCHDPPDARRDSAR